MKYHQHPFASIRRIAAFCVVAALLLGSCSNEPEVVGSHNNNNNNRPGAPLIIRTTITDFTRIDGGEQTRATEAGNVTTFSDNDAIGLFAITGIGTSGATIVDGINNLEMTYKSADALADTQGSWMPPEGTDLAYTPGVTYIAYYPYKEGITINPTQSKEAIIASFAEMDALQPSTDQSTAEKYTASDLMTASGQPEAASTGKMVLSLKFTHSYALLTVNPYLKTPKYVAPENKFKYHKAVTQDKTDTGASDVMILGVKAYKLSASEFRAIVKPSAIVEGKVNGSYITHSAKIEFDGVTYPDGVPAGSTFICKVYTPLPIAEGATTRKLQIGDFFFKDGSIWPGGLDEAGDPALPSTAGNDCIGVVFWVGNPSDPDYLLAEDYPHCTNGLVLYKGAGGEFEQWSTSGSSIDYWYSSAQRPSDFSAPYITGTVYCQGYSNTKMMEKFIVSQNSDNVTELNILTVLNEFNSSSSSNIPRASKWYIPSVAEGRLLIFGEGKESGREGLELIDGQLQNIDGRVFLNNNTFWLNTEEIGTADTRNVAVIMRDATVKYVPKTNTYLIRFILAF